MSSSNCDSRTGSWNGPYFPPEGRGMFIGRLSRDGFVEATAELLDRKVTTFGISMTDDGGIDSLFSSCKKPEIPLREYIFRLVRYMHVPAAAHVIALIYLERATENGKIPLTQFTVHRLLATATILAAKHVQDQKYSQEKLEKIVGLSREPGELLALEKSLSAAMSHRYKVSEETRKVRDLEAHLPAFFLPYTWRSSDRGLCETRVLSECSSDDDGLLLSPTFVNLEEHRPYFSTSLETAWDFPGAIFGTALHHASGAHQASSAGPSGCDSTWYNRNDLHSLFNLLDADSGFDNMDGEHNPDGNVFMPPIDAGQAELRAFHVTQAEYNKKVHELEEALLQSRSSCLMSSLHGQAPAHGDRMEVQM